MELISYAGITEQGPFLKLNEDDLETDMGNNLFAVFDGIGGTGIGDVAVADVKKHLSTFYTRISGDPDSTLPFFYNEKFTLEGNALLNAIQCAHIKLKEANLPKPINERGAVSLAGVSFSDNLINIVSVGNCIVKSYRKGKIETLLRPDILSEISRDDHNPANLSCPMNALGLFDKLHFEIKEYRPDEGDLVLLMTDGVYTHVNDEELKFILQKDRLSLKEAAGELLELANSRGNLDNQTCLLLKF